MSQRWVDAENSLFFTFHFQNRFTFQFQKVNPSSRFWRWHKLSRHRRKRLRNSRCSIWLLHQQRSAVTFDLALVRRGADARVENSNWNLLRHDVERCSVWGEQNNLKDINHHLSILRSLRLLVYQIEVWLKTIQTICYRKSREYLGEHLGSKLSKDEGFESDQNQTIFIRSYCIFILQMKLKKNTRILTPANIM